MSAPSYTPEERVADLAARSARRRFLTVDRHTEAHGLRHDLRAALRDVSLTYNSGLVALEA